MKSLFGQFGVLRSLALACGLFLLAASSGCATTKVYHLNLDVTTAPSVLSAVSNAAGDMGYQVTYLATAVNVRYDHDTWIYYSVGEHDYSMCIVVTNDVPSNQVGARVGDAKVKGEEIWAKAMALRQTSRPGQPGAPSLTTLPSPAS
ncbi:MAG: hypothetical protein U1A78_23870 [Polyangia bacterium]